MFLVINENEGVEKLPYSERYKLFEHQESAVSYATSIGYSDPLGVGLSFKVGMLNLYQCGVVKVSIIRLEVVY